jgi:cytochrome c-type biogenesis protein CcmF
MVLGKLAIALAAVCALGVTVAFFYVGRGRREFVQWGRKAYYGFALFTTTAAAYLMYLFLAHDFRVEYVYSYSAIGDGLLYNIAGFWGGQQGTFLLWLTLSSIIGLWLVRRSDDEHAGYAMFYFMLTNLFLLTVLLVKSPFALLPGLPAGMVPPDGRGLNPLLQDPWMAIHPPVVFSGFAATSVPFALALAALTLGRYKEWVPRAQPWVIFSVVTLGTGLIMGGYWAYKVLGWGGYWAWDPVENSIVIPWFTSLALMHGLLIEKHEGSLRKSNLFIAMFTFVLIMFGTFLTRSGVLADFSVHSFVDLGLNAYLVMYMVGFTGLALFWLAYRYTSIKVPEVNKKLVSREFAVFMAMLIFAVTAGLVLIGTSSPLFTRLWGDPAAVTIDYYNRITFPLAIALALMMGVYPYFMWKGEGTHVWQKIGVAALMAVAGAAVAFSFGVRGPGYLLFAWSAIFAFFGNVLYLVFYFRLRWYAAGSYVAHMGFGIMLLGVLASSAFSTTEKIELRQGEVGRALGLDLKYVGKMQDEAGQSGRLEVAVRQGDRYYMAHPRFYWSEFNQGYMRKPHVEKSLFYDIYIAPEEHYAPGENPGEKLTNTLELVKGETKTYDQVDYTFEGFDIGGHGEQEASGDMRVTARLTAKPYGGKPEAIAPYLELTADNRKVTGDAKVSNGTVVELAGIQADAGAVLLSFSGAGQGQVQQASLLVLEVSRKPLVSLVWMGAVLVVIGALLALFLRSRNELLAAAAGAPARDTRSRSKHQLVSE